LYAIFQALRSGKTSTFAFHHTWLHGAFDLATDSTIAASSWSSQSMSKFGALVLASSVALMTFSVNSLFALQYVE